MEITYAMTRNFNRILYIGFVLLSAYFAIFRQDFGQAAIQAGIALAFDPFNPEQKWNDRPIWQRAWLIIHLGCTAALFGLQIGLQDRIG